jgi:hypothetical protein
MRLNTAVKDTRWGLGLAALAGMLFLAPGPANAGAIIFDNGAPDLLNAWASDPGFLEGLGIQQWDDFSLSPGANVVGDIHWWGVYDFGTPAEPDEFAIEIFEDVGGLPDLNTGVKVFTGEAGRVATGDKVLGQFDLYAYWVDISPISFAPSTDYWISIVNDSQAGGGDTWYWATSSQTGIHAEAVGGDDPFNVDGELAFNLTGPASEVPEPSTALLFGVGLLLVRRVRRRSC